MPTLAALLVLLGTRNRAGFVLLLKRFNPLGLNRVPLKSAAGSYALLTFGILLCRSVSCWFRDIIGQDYQRDSLSLTRGLLFAILISSLLDLGAITVSIIAFFFMNRIGGSLIPAILVQGLVNDTIGIAGQATSERAFTARHQIAKALPFLIFAVLLIVWMGSSLCYPGTSSEEPGG